MYWNLPNGCWGSQEVVAEWRGVDVITSLGDDASLYLEVVNETFAEGDRQ